MSAKVFDIAIIGGGIIGLTLARALQRYKAQVVIIDAGAKIPPATNAAAGMLAPSFEEAIAADEALYAFGAYSLGMWSDFAIALQEETGQSIDYRADGILGIAFDEGGARRLNSEAEALFDRGADIEVLSGGDARELEPALSEKVAGAIYAKKDAQVDPRKTLAALHLAFTKNGGTLFSHLVDVVTQSNSAFEIVLGNGDRIAAGRLVIASGAAARSLIDDLPPPPIRSVKGEAVAVAAPDVAFRRVIRAPGAYLCPKAGGRVIIGATEIEHLDDYDVDDEAIAALVAHGARAVPTIARFPEVERWAGLRPATPDGAPILGHDLRGPEGVFLALGHHRNGILLAPASAEALAPEILGGGEAIETAAFRPSRFSGAKYG